MTTAVHRAVEQARAGALPRCIARTRSGWAVLAESQRLPGYALLLPDPVAGSLNELDSRRRALFLEDMAALGDAVIAACAPLRLNYAMLGNQEHALHAHVIPRYDWEPAPLRAASIWAYPPEQWNDPAHAFDQRAHAALRDGIAAALERAGAAP